MNILYNTPMLNLPLKKLAILTVGRQKHYKKGEKKEYRKTMSSHHAETRWTSMESDCSVTMHNECQKITTEAFGVWRTLDVKCGVC